MCPGSGGWSESVDGVRPVRATQLPGVAGVPVRNRSLTGAELGEAVTNRQVEVAAPRRDARGRPAGSGGGRRSAVDGIRVRNKVLSGRDLGVAPRWAVGAVRSDVRVQGRSDRSQVEEGLAAGRNGDWNEAIDGVRVQDKVLTRPGAVGQRKLADVGTPSKEKIDVGCVPCCESGGTRRPKEAESESVQIRTQPGGCPGRRTRRREMAGDPGERLEPRREVSPGATLVPVPECESAEISVG